MSHVNIHGNRTSIHYPAPGCHSIALGCLYTIVAAAARRLCSGRASGRRGGALIQFGSVDPGTNLVNLVHNGYPTFIGTAAPNIGRRR
ncbi:hypothetical protein EJB05_19238 [Eragrostis curvula]|uniref:Uncharacterized protein n=1 Tax=Eragrostis curvula TaxID=38414 RepID=A0A5J9UXG7_9POAL|nr:hypothetical protein EJB05_19238 [Eragrostis curvula]